MKIYHYTDNKIKGGKVEVKHFGENDYTARDARACHVKRAFYFTSPEPPEARFKDCKYQYITEVAGHSLYNLKEDKDELVARHKDINGIINHIKRAGFKGVIYNIGYDIVCLFYAVKTREV